MKTQPIKKASLTQHILHKVIVFTKLYGKKPTHLRLSSTLYTLLRREVELIVKFQVTEDNPILYFNDMQIVLTQPSDIVSIMPEVLRPEAKGLVYEIRR